MTKHIKIMSNEKVLFEALIDDCSDCPCYHDGCGEYADSCLLNEYLSEPNHEMRMPLDKISPQCPLEDDEGAEE